MAYTFNYIPSRGMSKSSKPRVLTAQFGDGYSQRIGDGINRTTKSWNLTFTSRSIEDANNIEEFLEARGGVQGFIWTPPNETRNYSVICQEWTRVDESPISATIQATFVQIFDVLV